MNYAVALIAVGAIYFILAKTGLTLALVHPSATPIWPPTGFALAAILLWGYRMWPAILLGAMVANATTAGSIATSIAIGGGNLLEALVGAFLINRWSNGCATFAAPNGVTRFVAICVLVATPVSATVGVGSLALAGFAEWQHFLGIWVTWWLGDIAGAVVVTPVVVLWTISKFRTFSRNELTETASVLAAAVLVGLVAFSPWFENIASRGPLAFFAILPLLWAALRCGTRDTATAALILAGCAVWGTLLGAGPFASGDLNYSFLLVLTFVISVSVPSLALSADVAMRKDTEESLRNSHADLDRRVEARTAELAAANKALKTEIEQRRRIESELEQQQVHLLEAQRLANLGSWTWDVRRNEIIWSDQLYKIYGLRQDEFGGRYEDFIKLVHAEDRDRVSGQIKQAYEGATAFQIDERIIRPSGEIRYLQSCGEVIRDAQGSVVRMLGICQDVTDRKRSEEALDLAREQLSQSQKLEALGQITGGVSHDFNNLLMIISGHVQILRKQLDKPAGKVAQALDALASAAKRGETLTRQLLSFSRRQRLDPVVVALSDRLDAIRALLGSSLRGDIKLECEFAPDIWRFEVDVAELELALLNIAVNARDAMPDGGTFTLTARNVTLRRDGRPPGLEGDFVALAMSDTGLGIPANVQAKIFEPFFTTKQVGKGTGLGLSQVYGFAAQSGGAVTVTSEVGKGTTITLFLPRSHRALPRGKVAAAPQVDAKGEGIALVVEDNREVAEVTASLLQQLGYDVLHATNANDALQTLENEGNIRFVLSDVVMPGGINGIDLAGKIALRFPKVPVLLTSGYSNAAQAAEANFRILRKPFELSALDKAIQELLEPGR